MKIVFKPNTIHVSKMGAVTGIVYFDFGADCQFPIAGWNDFVVVVAKWWLSALNQLSPEQRETELRFMDGPYWIKVISHGKSNVLLRCIEDRTGTRIICEVAVGMDELRSELLKLADDVSIACSSAGVESYDLENLRKVALGLRRYIQTKIK